MTLKLVNGDYVKDDNNKLEAIEYIDEVLQNATILLNANRGKFYPNKNFGSHIEKINSQPYDEYALAFARQALAVIDGVCVKSANRIGNLLTLDLTINNEERQVTLQLEDNI